MPCRGPRYPPFASSRSAFRACRIASSGVSVMNALRRSSAAILSSVALVSSAAETLRPRTSRAAFSMVSPFRSLARTRIRLQEVGFEPLHIHGVEALDRLLDARVDLGQAVGRQRLAQARPASKRGRGVR